MSYTEETTQRYLEIGAEYYDDLKSTYETVAESRNCSVETVRRAVTEYQSAKNLPPKRRSVVISKSWVDEALTQYPEYTAIQFVDLFEAQHPGHRPAYKTMQRRIREGRGRLDRS